MEAVLKIVQPIVESLSRDFEKCEPVVLIANKLKVKPGYVVGAFFLVGLLLILTGIASEFVTAVMGFLYPAYMSFKALESESDCDDTQWLTYWVVFVLMTFIDTAFGFVLSFIPLYHILKLIFYIYLFYPKSKGATVIYNNLLKPLLKKYESKIDATLNQVGEQVGKIEKTFEKQQ